MAKDTTGSLCLLLSSQHYSVVLARPWGQNDDYSSSSSQLINSDYLLYYLQKFKPSK